MGVFPEQEYFGFLGSNGITGFVGCWKIADAQKIADELRSEGFHVKMRGRGSRKKCFAETNRHSYDGLPLRYASHASLYIIDCEIYDEVETVVDSRVEALVAAL